MIVLQQNCGKGYESTVSALEAGLNAAVLCIQEPFWEIEAFLMQLTTFIGLPGQAIGRTCGL